MRKRAAIAIQFNWIFILIVGALILIFFFTIINKTRQGAEKNINIEMLSYFETILAGTTVKSGTLENYSLAGGSLELSSDFYSFQKDQRRIRNKIIFGPDLIKGEKLIVLTDFWSMPYKIDFFVYLTSNEVRYIIIEEDQNLPYVTDISELLPDSDFIRKERQNYLRLTDLTDLNYYKVRFIFVNSDLEPDEMSYFEGNLAKKKDFSAVKITYNEDVDMYGEIQFYKKQGDSLVKDEQPLPYLKKETLRGAIFAEDAKFYGDSLKKALAKLDIISTIYMNNSMELKNHFGNDIVLSNRGCPVTLDYIMEYISKILMNEKYLTLPNFITLYDAAKYIDEYNNELRPNCRTYLY